MSGFRVRAIKMRLDRRYQDLQEVEHQMKQTTARALGGQLLVKFIRIFLFRRPQYSLQDMQVIREVTNFLRWRVGVVRMWRSDLLRDITSLEYRLYDSSPSSTPKRDRDNHQDRSGADNHTEPEQAEHHQSGIYGAIGTPPASSGGGDHYVDPWRHARNF